MTYADQIRQLQTQYDLYMNKAARLGMTREGLTCYAEAAAVQIQLSKMVDG